MTNADHRPEDSYRAGTSLADALESMSQRGEAMAPPPENAYRAVRGRIRARRAAKTAGAGMLSVAAVGAVALGALYGPPDHKGYAPGVSGFTAAPSGVPGLGSSLTAAVLDGHQPADWQGTLLACGARLSEVLGMGRSPSDAAASRSSSGSPSGDDAGRASSGYGLEILGADRNTLTVRRVSDPESSDVLAGQVSYVWTQRDKVVSLPGDIVGGELAEPDDGTRQDSPSAASTCLADEAGGSAPEAEAGDPAGTDGVVVPNLPAGTYELRAYQYLAPEGAGKSAATVDASIADPASWSAPVTVRVAEDGAIVPVN
ncbi:hypothetical protein [Myceligenerans crystallogenes]|uniref:Uncharacterized protein n=1 Tax=Myceligenerans crystallogenes TaxID=316335 RepID=A0ABN2N2B9_9MICO